MAELVFNCPSCNSTEGKKDGKYIKCKFCGNLYRANLMDEPMYVDLRYAVNKRQEANFDDARRCYDKLIKNNPEDSSLEEAYWGRFLCEQYVIFYQNDMGESIPSFWEINREHYSKSHSYQKAIEYGAFSGNRENYERLAERIEEYKKKYVKVKEEYPDGYQVFICFKDSGTNDRNLGYDLYNEFSGKYKIFFSPKSLNEISGNDYEPYIYHALKTARVLLVLCSSRDALESKWVHNEWWRFYKFSNGTDRTIIPIFRRGFEEAQLPQEIKNCQGHYENVKLVSDLSERLSAILHNDTVRVPLTSFDKELNSIERLWNEGNPDDANIMINELIRNNVNKPHNHVSALLLKAKINSRNYSDIKNTQAKLSWNQAEEIAKANGVPIKDMKEYKAYRAKIAGKRARNVILSVLLAALVTAGVLFGIYMMQDPAVDMYVTGRPSAIDVEYGSNHIAALPTVTVVTRKGNKTEVEITDSMVKGFDPAKMGPQTVTVTYDGMSIQVSINLVKYSLASPTGLTVDNGKIVWENINLAESYTLMVNNTVIDGIQSNFYEESLFPEPGIYSVKVKANANGSVGKDSGYSDVISVIKLAEASGLVCNGAVLGWTAIPNCTEYGIYVNGEKIGTALTNSYTVSSDALSDGKNTVCVVPSGIGNVKLLSDASEYEQSNYTKNGTVSLYKYAYASGLKLEGMTLSWTEVAGCTKYDVYLNSNKIASCEGTSYDVPYGKFVSGKNEFYVTPVSVPNISDKAGDEGTDYSSGGRTSVYKYDRASGLVLDGNTIKWSEVEGATGYSVYLNDAKVSETESNFYEISESLLATSGNKIYVIPKGSCNLSSTASDGNDFTGNGVISLDRLSEVTGLSYSDKEISWNAVDGADEYEIYVNGVLLDTTYETFYSLADVSTSTARTDVYTVRACGTNVIPSAVSTEKITLTYLASPSNVNISGTVLSWSAVESAHEYHIYANAGLVKAVNASTLSFNLLGTLAKGTYEIRVIPVGENDNVISPDAVSYLDYTVTETIIYVSTESGLKNMRLDLSAVYILQNDITLTEPWTPIGNTATPFNGRFNGAGYIISGLELIASSGEGTGLFGVVGESGTVENVTLKGVSCSSASYGNVAAIAGINRGTVSDVTVSGSVNAEGCDYVGGIVGRNYGSIYNATNHANVTGRKNVGGISGGSEISDYSIQIYGCKNDGDVVGNFRVGGVMGNVQISKKVTLYGLVNEGKVTCATEYCGGIFGNVAGSSGQIGTLNSCVNYADVTAVGYVGGCFGNVGGYINVTLDNALEPSLNCKNSGVVEATGGSNYGNIYPGA